MRVAHLFKGVSLSGRFAITACSEPSPLKKWIHTTRFIGDVSCKRCLKRINATGITQAELDELNEQITIE